MIFKYNIYNINNIFPFTNITNKKLQSVSRNEKYHADDSRKFNQPF